jgi:anti-anti-sigma factor
MQLEFIKPNYIKFLGEFMASDFEETKKEVSKIFISTDGNLIFDFEQIPFISSVAIGLIAYFHKLLDERGNKLLIINVQNNVYSMITKIIPNSLLNIKKIK